MNKTDPKELKKPRRTKAREEDQDEEAMEENAGAEDVVGQHEAAEEEEPIEEEEEFAEARPRRSKVGVAARLAALPVKEIYFVGLGALDWAFENLWVVERTLADRGVRRNEAMRQGASRLSTSAKAKAQPAINKATEGVEKIGETVAAGSRKMRRRIPAEQQVRGEEEAPPAMGMQEEQPHPA